MQLGRGGSHSTEMAGKDLVPLGNVASVVTFELKIERELKFPVQQARKGNPTEQGLLDAFARPGALRVPLVQDGNLRQFTDRLGTFSHSSLVKGNRFTVQEDPDDSDRQAASERIDVDMGVLATQAGNFFASASEPGARLSAKSTLGCGCHLGCTSMPRAMILSTKQWQVQLGTNTCRIT